MGHWLWSFFSCSCCFYFSHEHWFFPFFDVIFSSFFPAVCEPDHCLSVTRRWGSGQVVPPKCGWVDLWGSPRECIVKTVGPGLCQRGSAAVGRGEWAPPPAPPTSLNNGLFFGNLIGAHGGIVLYYFPPKKSSLLNKRAGGAFFRAAPPPR